LTTRVGQDRVHGNAARQLLFSRGCDKVLLLLTPGLAFTDTCCVVLELVMLIGGNAKHLQDVKR
jgi:hypothetical protein